MPQGLETLICCNNELKSLPELPDSIKEIHCDKNKIKKLPKLPANLERLWCTNNPLKEFPELPSKLRVLYTPSIKSLPVLPNSLVTLDCSYSSKLIELPKLPSSLVSLTCNSCNLTELPELPNSLTDLTCGKNNWSKPIKFEYMERFGNSNPWGFKGRNVYKLREVYTKEQIEKIKSYEFQKEFLEREPESFKDLEPFKYAKGIEEEFDYLFNADDFCLMFTK